MSLVQNRENIGACGNTKHDALAKWCRRLRDQKWFQYFMIAIIVAAGVLVGVQTYFPRTDNPSVVISYVFTASYGRFAHFW